MDKNVRSPQVATEALRRIVSGKSSNKAELAGISIRSALEGAAQSAVPTIETLNYQG